MHFSLVGPLVLSGELWRLASYQFLHGGIWHLGQNLWRLPTGPITFSF
ncbi:MAG: rhomboid family intramembrane serine protease [bacterium]